MQKFKGAHCTQSSVIYSPPRFAPMPYHELYKKSIKQRSIKPVSIDFSSKTFLGYRVSVSEMHEEKHRNVLQQKTWSESFIQDKSSPKGSHLSKAIAQSQEIKYEINKAQNKNYSQKESAVRQIEEKRVKSYSTQGNNDICSVILTINPLSSSTEKQSQSLSQFNSAVQLSEQELITLLQINKISVSQKLTQDIKKILNKLSISLKGTSSSEIIANMQERKFQTKDSLTSQESAKQRESFKLSEMFVSTQISNMVMNLNALKSMLFFQDKSSNELKRPLCGLPHCKIHTWHDHGVDPKISEKILKLQDDLGKLAGEISKRKREYECFFDYQNAQTNFNVKKQESYSRYDAKIEKNNGKYINLLKMKDEEIMRLNATIGELRKPIIVNQEYSQIYERLCFEVKNFIIIMDNLTKAIEIKDEENIDKYKQECNEQRDLIIQLVSPNNVALENEPNTEVNCEKYTEEIQIYQKNLADCVEQIKNQEIEIERLRENIKQNNEDPEYKYYSKKYTHKKFETNEIISDAILKIEVASENLLGEYAINMDMINERMSQVGDKISLLRTAFKRLKIKQGFPNKNTEDRIRQLKEENDMLREKYNTIQEESEGLNEKMEQQDKILIHDKIKQKEDIHKLIRNFKKYLKKVYDFVKINIGKSNELMKNDLEEKTNQIINLKEIIIGNYNHSFNLRQEAIKKQNYQSNVKVEEEEALKKKVESQKEEIKAKEIQIKGINEELWEIKEKYTELMTLKEKQVADYASTIEEKDCEIAANNETLKNQKVLLSFCTKLFQETNTKSSIKIETIYSLVCAHITQSKDLTDKYNVTIQRLRALKNQCQENKKAEEVFMQKLKKGEEEAIQAKKSIEIVNLNLTEQIKKLNERNSELDQNLSKANTRITEIEKQNKLLEHANIQQEEQNNKLNNSISNLEAKLAIEIQQNNEKAKNMEKIDMAYKTFEKKATEKEKAIVQISKEKATLIKSNAELNKKIKEIELKLQKQNAEVIIKLKDFKLAIATIKEECTGIMNGQYSNFININAIILENIKQYVLKYENNKDSLKEYELKIVSNSTENQEKLVALREEISEYKIIINKHKQQIQNISSIFGSFVFESKDSFVKFKDEIQSRLREQSGYIIKILDCWKREEGKIQLSNEYYLILT